MPGTSLPETCILKFTATWCGPCQKIKPLLANDAKLRICTIDDISSSDSSHILVVEVDVDHHVAVSEKFNITSLPTLKFCKDGVVLEELTVQGADSTTILRNIETYKKKLHHIHLPICKEAKVKSW